MADKAITTPALREHQRQRQMIKKSVMALKEVPISYRVSSGMTMNIDSSKLGEARRLIDEFALKLSELLELRKHNNMFQLNLNLFPLGSFESES